MGHFFTAPVAADGRLVVLRSLASIAVAHFVLVACREQRHVLGRAECSAVAAVLDTMVAMRGDRRIVLEDSTIARSVRSGAEKDLNRVVGLTPSTRASYVERSMHSTASCRGLAVRVPVSYASRGSIDSLYARHGDAWGPAFTARYPGAEAFTTEIHVGLSADGRQALVRVTSQCAGRCASNAVLILVEKSADGRWQLRHAEEIWFS